MLQLSLAPLAGQILSTALLFTPHAAVVTSPPTPVSSLTATIPRLRMVTSAYQFVGGKNEDRARKKAIDKVVAEMSFFVRPFARSALKDATPIPKQVKVYREADHVVVAFDGRTYRGRADGKPVSVVGQEGKKLTMTCAITPSEVIVTFAGESGKESNRFTFGAAGQLALEVTISSKRLPLPLTYRLSYKQSAAAPSAG